MDDYQFSFIQRIEHRELVRRAQQERLGREVVRLRRERRRRAPVVTLAPTVPEDLADLTRWVRSEQEMGAWAGRALRWPLSPDQLHALLASSPERPGTTWTAWSDGRRVGTARVDLHHQGRVAELGRVLVSGGRQPEAVATAVVRRVVEAAFESPRTEVLRLCVDASDGKRRTVYERVGFRPFLVQANAVSIGAPTWDRVVEMAMERPGRAAA